MGLTSHLTSACRYCHFYRSEGRRGGHCQQLGVPVRADWKACSLARSPFTPHWKKLDEIIAWQQDDLADPLPLDAVFNSSVREDTSPQEIACFTSQESA